MAFNFAPELPPEPIQPATVPIYWTDDEEGPLFQDRTGLLLQLANKHLLVTAEHDLFLGTGRLLYASTTNLVLHNRQARTVDTVELIIIVYLIQAGEPLDYAVIELSQECSEVLINQGMHFLRPHQLVKVSNYNDEHFILSGHPFFLTNDNLTRTVSPYCWFDTSPIAVEQRPNVSEYIVLKFPTDIFNPDGEEIHVEELEGFSGCGMWLMLEGDQGAAVPRLAGVFHRCTSRVDIDEIEIPVECRCIKGTRIDFILEGIRRKWPETGNAIDEIPTYPPMRDELTSCRSITQFLRYFCQLIMRPFRVSCGRV